METGRSDFLLSSYCADQGPVLFALRRAGPFWFDNLAPLLAQKRWSRFEAECGIDKSNYATARVLEGSPAVECNVIGYLQGPIADTQQPIMVECLRSNLTQRYREMGLEFYSADEIVGLNLLHMLDRAIKIIAGVQGAAIAVSAVLSAVHILKSKSPDYDVSYSEPALPFSIFVGIDPRVPFNRDLRLAESILHECMHLQLTLIEESISLIAFNNEHHLSPWRQTLRPTYGVLHALYVFRVIQDFFGAALSGLNLSDNERRHIRHRLREIDSEVEQMGNLSASQDLTCAGRALVARLQIGNNLQS